MVGNRELIAVADAHQWNAFLPAADEPGQRESRGFAAGHRAVEFGAVDESADIMDRDAIARARPRAIRAAAHLAIAQAGGCLPPTFGRTERVEIEELTIVVVRVALDRRRSGFLSGSHLTRDEEDQRRHEPRQFHLDFFL